MKEEKSFGIKDAILYGTLGAATVGVWSLGWGYDGTPDNSGNEFDCFESEVPEDSVTDNPCNTNIRDNVVVNHSILGIESVADISNYAEKVMTVPEAYAETESSESSFIQKHTDFAGKFLGDMASFGGEMATWWGEMFYSMAEDAGEMISWYASMPGEFLKTLDNPIPKADAYSPSTTAINTAVNTAIVTTIIASNSDADYSDMTTEDLLKGLGIAGGAVGGPIGGMMTYWKLNTGRWLG